MAAVILHKTTTSPHHVRTGFADRFREVRGALQKRFDGVLRVSHVGKNRKNSFEVYLVRDPAGHPGAAADPADEKQQASGASEVVYSKLARDEKSCAAS